MAPLTLPGMGVGTNAFTYTDESPSRRRVRITQQWVERSASRPPAAPSEPVFPPSGGVTDGTEITFQWRPATDPDGDAIADYHFELSGRADMKWPLSMSFAKLISRTADAGQARYTLPGPGLLNPGTKYFWHVRREMTRGYGDLGVQPGASRRRDLRLLKRSASNSTESATGASSAGRPIRWARSPWRTVSMPATRRAFPSSDRPYKVTVGVSEKMPSEFPANFVVETSANLLEVVGPHVKLEEANRAFYRVVAVDAAGNRSGPSDYAASPRPVDRQRTPDPSQQRGGLSLSGQGYPIAGRSQDQGRQWQGNDEVLGRGTGSIQYPARTAMAHNRRSDRSFVGDARSIGHDRGRCMRGRSSTTCAGWTRRLSSGESRKSFPPTRRRSAALLRASRLRWIRCKTWPRGGVDPGRNHQALGACSLTRSKKGTA